MVKNIAACAAVRMVVTLVAAVLLGFQYNGWSLFVVPWVCLLLFYRINIFLGDSGNWCGCQTGPRQNLKVPA